MSSIAYNKVIGLTETDFMFKKKTVVIYAEKNGREPFLEWLTSLKDRTFRARIRNRISRLELGHFGDCEPVGEGIFELRFFFGPGFRVYFAKHEDTTILLIGGGDKKTQAKDILKAKSCWKKFKEKENEKI